VGRLTQESLATSTISPAKRPRIYVCGSTGFAETVAAWLLDLGHATTDILTERFGGL
jgi:ferredoxin-NADP reductase